MPASPLLASLDTSSDSRDRWVAVSSNLAAHYPFILFTILSFSSPTEARRIYTNRPDLHPLGKRQPRTSRGHIQPDSHTSTTAPQPPKRADWLHRLFKEGKPWIGSTKADLRDVFEDWELLWENQLGSVLNVPIRRDGVTVGSLNLLDRERAYDELDLSMAENIAEALGRYI